MSGHVFVGNLPHSMNESDLREMFSKFGNISRIDVKVGFAFMFFEDIRDAEAAIAEMDKKEVDGKELDVAIARPKADKEARVAGMKSELRLRVTNLPHRLSWQDLKDWARNSGPVKYANVTERGINSYGIIEYETLDGFTSALKSLEDVPLRGQHATLSKDLSPPVEVPERNGGGGGGGDGGYRARENSSYEDRGRPAYDREPRRGGGGYDDHHSRGAGVGGGSYGGYQDNNRGGGGGGGNFRSSGYDGGFEYSHGRGGGQGSGGMDMRGAPSGGYDNRRMSGDDRGRAPAPSSGGGGGYYPRDDRDNMEFRGGAGAGGRGGSRSRSRDRGFEHRSRGTGAPVGGPAGNFGGDRMYSSGGGSGAGNYDNNRGGGNFGNQRGGGGGYDARGYDRR